MATNTKTYIPKLSEIERKCVLVNAEGQILGRLATRIAMVLMGKDEPFYTPHMECGDQVIVINAETVRVTGKKAKTKMYDRFSGFPGGRTEIPFEEVQQLYPERIITEAVRRMLPDTKMRDKMMKRLRVFKGSKHPHQAQKPVELKFT